MRGEPPEAHAVTHSAGHVFVTRGDLTKLACDAWLLPSDVHAGIRHGWRASIPEGSPNLPAGWGNRGRRVARWSSEADSGAPTPWLVNVGGLSDTDPGWFINGVQEFVAEASVALSGFAPLNRRARHLLGLPVVGTGAGGGSGVKGEVIHLLVATLQAAATETGVDLVLVTRDGPAFAATQSARRQMVAGGRDLWPDVGPALANAAERLAADALAGRLVLFLGAGVGAGAGLPMWDELLDDLGANAGIGEPEREEMRTQLGPTDRALVIERRLAAAGIKLGTAIADLLRGARCSLSHQLLAGLPVREAATMNYDRLFEDAWLEAGRRPAILPYQPTVDRDSWLLKMHGTIEKPDDIVLTRDDYLRYAERRAALAGIVQALLITRRMLFVGFSLADENFHRIAHDVRRALGSAAEKATFATALLLKEEPFLEEMWRGDIDCVAVTPAGPDPAAARGLEIFLDHLSFLSTSNTEHLLDRAYTGVLTKDELALREHLEKFWGDAPPEARSALAWSEVEAMLRRLGSGGSQCVT